MTKAYRVRFRLPDDTPLRIGMSTDVNVVVRVAPGALIVPTVAVDGTKVFVIENGEARLRTVETGIRGPSGIEVTRGLGDDARIVSPFPAHLADRARVAVTTVAAR